MLFSDFRHQDVSIEAVRAKVYSSRRVALLGVIGASRIMPRVRRLHRRD